MKLQIRDKSIKWTYIAMVVAVAIFSFIRSEQGLPMMDLSATMGFSVFVGETYRYVKCKEKGCSDRDYGILNSSCFLYFKLYWIIII